MQWTDFLSENETGKGSLMRLAALLTVLIVLGRYAITADVHAEMLVFAAAVLGVKGVQRFGEKYTSNAP